MSLASIWRKAVAVVKDRGSNEMIKNSLFPLAMGLSASAAFSLVATGGLEALVPTAIGMGGGLVIAKAVIGTINVLS